MDPPRPRASPSLSPPLLLLLLLGGGCLAAARRDKAESGPADGSSGRFVSPEQHACSWQLLLPGPGAAAASEVALHCQAPDGARHHCAYRGEPERCAAYGARRPHYWRQVLGALRKRPRPCHHPAPLQPRVCAGKKGHGAELRLVTRATAATFPGEPGIGARTRARLRPPAPRPSAPPKEKPAERKPRGRKRKVSDPVEERPMATGPDSDGLEENAELTETYCSEKWHSLCNFFVNFWNG